MNDPDPALELLARHLQNLHESLRGIDIRLRKIEAAVAPWGEPKARIVAWHPVQAGEDPGAA